MVDWRMSSSLNRLLVSQKQRSWGRPHRFSHHETGHSLRHHHSETAMCVCHTHQSFVFVTPSTWLIPNTTITSSKSSLHYSTTSSAYPSPSPTNDKIKRSLHLLLSRRLLSCLSSTPQVLQKHLFFTLEPLWTTNRTQRGNDLKSWRQ